MRRKTSALCQSCFVMVALFPFGMRKMEPLAKDALVSVQISTVVKIMLFDAADGLLCLFQRGVRFLALASALNETRYFIAHSRAPTIAINALFNMRRTATAGSMSSA